MQENTAVLGCIPWTCTNLCHCSVSKVRTSIILSDHRDYLRYLHTHKTPTTRISDSAYRSSTLFMFYALHRKSSYATSSDREGTFGRLVELEKAGPLEYILQKCLSDAQWYPSAPICI